MALQTNYVKYSTDDGQETLIRVNYDESNSQDRLTDGDFTGNNVVTAGCKSTTSRRLLKPRYIETSNKGKIYFRTHDKWKDYIEPNKDNVTKVVGEQLSCTAVHLLYS